MFWKKRNAFEQFGHDTGKQIKKVQKEAGKIIDKIEPDKKFAEVTEQIGKLPEKAVDFVQNLELDKKFNQAVEAIKHVPDETAHLVDKIEPDKKFEQATKTLKDVPDKVHDLADKLEVEKKFNQVVEAVRHSTDKVTELIDKSKPTDNAPLEINASADELAEKAVALTGQYEIGVEKKKSHFLRNTLALGAATVGGLAWNNQRIWKDIPAWTNPLPGDAKQYQSKYGQVFYKEAGHPENPPLVLMHGVGAGSSSYDWRNNFDELSRDFHVYAFDLLGFGNSAHPQIDYSADVYIEQLTQFLQNVVKQPATVVAASLSGGYAIQVADKQPSLITKLILVQPAGINPAAKNPGPNAGAGIVFPILRLPVIGQALYSGVSARNSIRAFMESQLYCNKEMVTDKLVNDYHTIAHQPGAEHAALAFLAGKLNTRIDDAFARLNQPVLLVWGRESLITPPQEGHELVKRGKVAQLVVLEAARLASYEEKADSFNRLVKQFARDEATDVESILNNIEVALG